VALAAWAAQPRGPGFDEPLDVVGQMLFPDFTNPLDATSLEVIQFDEQAGAARPFKVEQIGTRWSIPSHRTTPPTPRTSSSTPPPTS